ncbi:hypothetical protein V9L05_08655 [Bernardetia sp. Wsw4-3y2]|uniref:hypothetical protein n=1 Tax=Bernardetia sp. Wsw4-3y2 TaxID=3127471 RepID=UPI0030D44AB8
MRETRKQTVTITLASGATEGTIVEGQINLDKAFDRVVGVCVYENFNPSVPYQIILKDEKGNVNDYVNSLDYQAKQSSNHPAEKYAPINLNVDDSNILTIRAKMLGATTTNLSFDFVVLLAKDKPTNC